MYLSWDDTLLDPTELQSLATFVYWIRCIRGWFIVATHWGHMPMWEGYHSKRPLEKNHDVAKDTKKHLCCFFWVKNVKAILKYLCGGAQQVVIATPPLGYIHPCTADELYIWLHKKHIIKLVVVKMILKECSNLQNLQPDALNLATLIRWGLIVMEGSYSTTISFSGMFLLCDSLKYTHTHLMPWQPSRWWIRFVRCVYWDNGMTVRDSFTVCTQSVDVWSSIKADDQPSNRQL